jgi:ankyrin repeat protein
VNVNEQARDGATAILWAVHQSDLKAVRALLAAGANVNTPNRYGVTPLLEASRTGDTPIIAELLKAGADVKESLHPDGETPLIGGVTHTASLDAIELLLKAGSDPNAADNYQKQTALMWAAEEGMSTSSRRCWPPKPIRMPRRGYRHSPLAKMPITLRAALRR